MSCEWVEKKHQDSPLCYKDNKAFREGLCEILSTCETPSESFSLRIGSLTSLSALCQGSFPHGWTLLHLTLTTWKCESHKHTHAHQEQLCLWHRFGSQDGFSEIRFACWGSVLTHNHHGRRPTTREIWSGDESQREREERGCKVSRHEGEESSLVTCCFAWRRNFYLWVEVMGGLSDKSSTCHYTHWGQWCKSVWGAPQLISWFTRQGVCVCVKEGGTQTHSAKGQRPAVTVIAAIRSKAWTWLCSVCFGRSRLTASQRKIFHLKKKKKKKIHFISTYLY